MKLSVNENQPEKLTGEDEHSGGTGMSEKQMRSLSIQEWRQLALEGAMLPVTIRLDGDSMRPLIRRGLDAVTILPLNRPLKIGDIVLFQDSQNRYVVHRVYRLRDGLVQTYGDNCWNPDPWMPHEKVWGLVPRMQRNGHSYCLDCRLARWWGRGWMFFHQVRKIYITCRGFAARTLKWMRRGGRADEPTGCG